MSIDRRALLAALKTYRDETTSGRAVAAYAGPGAAGYEDALNKGFVYGAITRRFLEAIRLDARDRWCVDIGCGTGFAFEVLGEQLEGADLHGLGLDPARAMVEIAQRRHVNGPRVSFARGCFEGIPLRDRSVDRIVTTLALHWVNDLEAAAREMRRVLKDDGRVDVLMIAGDDGARFKRAVVRAMRKHLSFKQIMAAAALVQRVDADDLRRAFESFAGCEIRVENPRRMFFGSFDDCMFINWLIDL